MADMLRARARRTPDAEAFVWLGNGEREDARTTFGELDRRARAITSLLLKADWTGKPVLLAYASGIDLLAALFGCFNVGSIAVVAPLPGSQTTDRLRLIAADSGAIGLLTVSSLVRKAQEETLAGLRVLATDELGETDKPETEPRSAPDPNDLAMLQYTSGSTASPRGVMLTHANLMANLRAQAQATEIREGETALSWLPFHHDMGLFGFGLFPIYAGLRCVLMPPVAFLKRPIRWLEAISRHRAVLSAGPCFAFDLAARRSTAEQRAALDLSCWRVAVCGGEMVRPATLETFADVFAPAGFRRSALAPAYGLAESTLLAASVRAERGFAIQSVDRLLLLGGRAAPPLNPDRERRLIACGCPWPDHEAIIVDPVSRTARDRGDVGEIWLRGPSVSQGYWGRAAENPPLFDARLAGEDSSGWLRTGDVGFASEDGLVVTGRRKDLIIVRGANFDPLDLELAAETSHTAFAAGGAAAFSFDDTEGEKVVIASEVERAAMKSLDADEVVASVAAVMSATFGLTLHDLVLLKSGALPRTTSGKVQRHLCREFYLADSLTRLDEKPHPELGRWRPARP